MREFNLQHSKTKSEQILSPGTPVLLAVFLKNLNLNWKWNSGVKMLPRGRSDRIAFHFVSSRPPEQRGFHHCLPQLPSKGLLTGPARGCGFLGWPLLLLYSRVHWFWPAYPLLLPFVFELPESSAYLRGCSQELTLLMQRTSLLTAFFAQGFLLWSLVHLKCGQAAFFGTCFNCKMWRG